MEVNMKENFIIAGIAFIIVFTVLYALNDYKLKAIKKNKRKKGKEYTILELRFLALSNNLKMEKLLQKKFIIIISLINAFIITSVFLVIILLPWSIVWQLLLGFVLLLGLIYAFYGIMGAILKKKGYDK